MKRYSSGRSAISTFCVGIVVACALQLVSATVRASEAFVAEHYAAMHAKYSDQGLVIIGVNLDMERADAERFLEEYPADFSIMYDDNQELARAYEVVAMPSSYVLGRDGEVVAQHMGFKVRQQDEYEAIIVEALRQPASNDE